MDTITQAFKAVPRKHFLLRDLADLAKYDSPLPIGFGQTNSQPSTVAMMLDWLAVEPGDRILDVGSGSGWTSALLAHLTGPRGRVVAVEVVPELVEFGRSNCARLGIRNVRFNQTGEKYGWPAAAPYDRILVSATARQVPADLIAQLAPGGRMVIPVKDSVFEIEKDADGRLEQREHYGFAFVPLVDTKRKHVLRS